ncbi:MAG: NAD(P)/FAD-dependent oxidoreductase [Oscillospiraceae bacterium]|jgi:2,4-dienoyl-CoA reductase-like NADH-dependent reductase (Old Yellow Enzyme family)/thioredoxin reductase|nr:NAD(P)/FAD-dependent oxidoreductase [Oscillospiraceae bacterium]
MATNKYFPLMGEPIKLGNLTLKNRVIAAPISPPDFGPDSGLTKDNVAFYDYRARGGMSVVTVSEGIVDMETGRSHTKQLALDDPLIIPSLAETARAIHKHNCFASIELSHGGKFAGARAHDAAGKSMKRYGPIAETLPDGAQIHEMPEELILKIADCFGKAALVVKKAGFDMVLVHAAHGWLLHQFMSPAQNTRTDKWGGSLENRMRFPLLVIEKIRENVGRGFPIEFRYSGAEYIPNGYGIDYGIEIAKAVDGYVDLIHVSAGVHENHDTFVITHPTMFLPHGSNVHLAAAVKPHVKTPVATLGGLNDPNDVEKILAEGKADIVELARQHLCDPYFVKKALSGQSEDITKCCRCFTCFGAFLTNRIAMCALNPVVGYELDNSLGFAARAPKNVVIAGGGPGGMAAALQAVRQGHRVKLFEKGGRLGGQLLSEEHVPFKRDLYAYAVQQAKRVEESGVEVFLNTELTPELLEKIGADVLVCAVGAKPLIPPVEGLLEGGKLAPSVKTLSALHSQTPDVGESVVILGGGLVGSETAVYLDELGKKVTVVEMRDDFAPDAPEMHHTGLEHKFRDNNVKLMLKTRAKTVLPEGLLVETDDGTEKIVEADTILLAAGFVPNTDIVSALSNIAPTTFSVGDCVKVGKVVDAVYNGYYGANDI